MLSNSLYRSIQFNIEGESNPILEILLNKGESAIVRPGKLIGFTATEISTSAGFFEGLERKFLLGESFFLIEAANKSSETVEKLYVSQGKPGDIFELDFDGRNEWFVRKGRFLAGTSNTKIVAESKSIWNALFLPELGFWYEKLKSSDGTSGKAFLSSKGSLIRRNLQAGEEILLMPDNIMAFQGGEIDFKFSPKMGVINTLFGWKKMFLAAFKGPGEVILGSDSKRRILTERVVVERQTDVIPRDRK